MLICDPLPCYPDSGYSETGAAGAAGVDTEYRAAVVAVVIADVPADCEDAARIVAEGADNDHMTVLRQALSLLGNPPGDIALARRME